MSTGAEPTRRQRIEALHRRTTGVGTRNVYRDGYNSALRDVLAILDSEPPESTIGEANDRQDRRLREWGDDPDRRASTDAREALADRIAVALARYEMDEPHWDEEGSPAPDEAAHITAKWLREQLRAPHCGDCTNEPHTCVRCSAEHWWHKAGWIAAALRADAGAGEREVSDTTPVLVSPPHHGCGHIGLRVMQWVCKVCDYRETATFREAARASAPPELKDHDNV